MKRRGGLRRVLLPADDALIYPLVDGRRSAAVTPLLRRYAAVTPAELTAVLAVGSLAGFSCAAFAGRCVAAATAAAAVYRARRSTQ